MISLSTRALWLAWTVLLSLIIGLIGAVLTSMGGADLANAIITGAIAFSGTVALTLLVLGFLTPNQPTTRHDTSKDH